MSGWSSWASSVGGLAAGLAAQAQEGLRSVESSIDHAMGIDTAEQEHQNKLQTAGINSASTPAVSPAVAAPVTGGKAKAAPAKSVSPAVNGDAVQGIDADKQQLLSRAAGDFFSSFMAPVAAVVAAPATTASPASAKQKKGGAA